MAKAETTRKQKTVSKNESDQKGTTLSSVKSQSQPSKGRTLKEDESPEEVLKARKVKAKAAKKAGPKAKRAKADEENPDSAARVSSETSEKPKKKTQQHTRKSRLERRGKKYRQVIEVIEKNKQYSLDEAVEVLPRTSFVKFDPTVEVHIKLGVDPKQADQNIRATVVLPHSSGKTQRVAVFASPDKHKEAKAAGADVVGEADLLEEIKKGNFDFDILVATPDVMAQLGKYAKQLGPKGLMPNPKSGTVSNDLAKTVKELKSGRIEFRVDPSGIVHQAIGKLSLGPKLKDNLQSFIKAVAQAKPASLKGVYIESAYLSTSMGPSLPLQVKEIES